VTPCPRSLCTMLSLQWEPEIIAVAVMYLAGRLCKFDIQEWTAKQSSRRWWEQFVQDVPVELLEGTGQTAAPASTSSARVTLPLCPDICHQILDLYSQGNKPIPQQIQEKERAAPQAPVPQAPIPPMPQGLPPAPTPPPPPPKKTSPQGGSPARLVKRSHVSTLTDTRPSFRLLPSKMELSIPVSSSRHPPKRNPRLQVRRRLSHDVWRAAEDDELL